MRRVAVVYFSGGGTTARLAEAVRAGAAEAAEAVLCRIAGATLGWGGRSKLASGAGNAR